MDERDFKAMNDEVNISPFTFSLTKREYFAAMAMQGILTNIASNDIAEKTVAEVAVINADALLAELEKTQTQ